MTTSLTTGLLRRGGRIHQRRSPAFRAEHLRRFVAGFFVTLGVLALLVTTGRSRDIPVANSEFLDPYVFPDQRSFDISEWEIDGAASIDNAPFPFYVRHLRVEAGSSVSQDTGIKFKADTNYLLKVKIGTRSGLTTDQTISQFGFKNVPFSVAGGRRSCRQSRAGSVVPVRDGVQYRRLPSGCRVQCRDRVGVGLRESWSGAIVLR